MAFSDTPDSAVLLLGIGVPLLGLAFAALLTYWTSQIEVNFESRGGSDEKKSMLSEPLSGSINAGEVGEEEDTASDAVINERLQKISGYISTGAKAFLFREYLYMFAFMISFGAIVLFVLGAVRNWTTGVATCISFLVGCTTSIVAGYIGMSIAVFANSRTAVKSYEGVGSGFKTAFRAGSVMGFALVSLGILVLVILIEIYRGLFGKAYDNNGDCVTCTVTMYECIAGYGLGGSSIAMFGRVGGGIYTKAADVGADLAGKVDNDWDEDDPRNPAVIADNVGDNVGDIAGMGADLFGSFAEATCAALVLCAQSKDLAVNFTSMSFPIMLSAAGLIACFVTHFFATDFMPVANDDAIKNEAIEGALKVQLGVSTVLATPLIFAVSGLFLPYEFDISGQSVKWYQAGICVTIGLWSGLIIGFMTEYYTSYSYTPTQEVSKSTKTGAATNIIYGLALGYKSTIIPIVCLGASMFVGYALAKMFGVACAALGMLMTLATGLTIDGYGPITDNAGGIAEMSRMPAVVRDRTDALDAAGNTTAAIGKGFAIGSAALVSLALFGAFADTVGIYEIPLIGEWQFAGLVIGAMIPYWFFAMTMQSVGAAALEMVEEVRRQVESRGLSSEAKESKGADDGKLETSEEDYAKCIKIATDASLKEMIAPGCLVLFTPLIIGFLFGVEMLAGLLLGALASGASMAISSSNTGGAWDNAKKYIKGEKMVLPVRNDETGRVELVRITKDGEEASPEMRAKVQEMFKSCREAAIIGDTVGDPLKDTSGPALNIVMKLMAIVSLVFARAFPSQSKGGLIQQALGL